MQAVLASLKNAQTFFPRGKACCLLSSFKELRAPLGYTCALRGRDMCSCLVAAVLRAPPTRQVQGPWALRTHSRLVIGAVYECAPTPACMQRPITKRAVPQNDTRWDAHACTHARTHTRTRIHARLRTQTNTCALARAHTQTHTHTHTHTHAVLCMQRPITELKGTTNIAHHFEAHSSGTAPQQGNGGNSRKARSSSNRNPSTLSSLTHQGSGQMGETSPAPGVSHWKWVPNALGADGRNQPCSWGESLDVGAQCTWGRWEKPALLLG